MPVRLVLFLLLASPLLRAQSMLPEKQNPRLRIQARADLPAYAFNPADVRLTGNSLFRHARDIDAGYILSLSPARLLSRFYRNAGLPVKDSAYGGWESAGLSGHTLGHYLSACALMYAGTGDERFKQRLTYTVTELAKCQAARKTGYVGAIPGEDSIFGRVRRGDIRSGGFDLNGGWSPWYTVHKVMAGLVDAYLYAGNAQALSVVRGMADWTQTIVGGLNDAQRQKMLQCEYGGMNDVLSILYSITGERKYLTLSYLFYDDFVMAPLAQGRPDPLAGRHSNTNIPKAIGSARQYELGRRAGDSLIAARAWRILTKDHSYVTGGNGNYEYLGQPGKLNDALSDNTTETCCAYNMLKLTGHLFAWQPGAALMDYAERTVYNDILASQNPATAMMLYFEPLRMGGKKQFSDSTETFTCCVGTGMENHAKYTEDIYFQGADGSLYVNLFIPSTLQWQERNATVVQQTGFPEETSTRLTLTLAQPKRFSLRIRNPWWNDRTATQFSVNGLSVHPTLDSNGYWLISRLWKTGDRVEVRFGMNLYTESMPDNPKRIAFLYGPLVLAGNLGDSMPDPIYGTPVFLTENRRLSDWTSAGDSALTFRTRGAGKPFDVSLTPFYRNVDNHYSVYWDLFSPADWAGRQADYEAEKKKAAETERRTIDYFRIGEMQPERDHELKASEESYVDEAFGRTGREVRRGGYFSFRMRLDSAKPAALLFTYLGDDRNRSFDILVDGVKIASVQLDGKTTGRFYDEQYDIPGDLLRGKSSVIVTVQSTNGKTAGRVFGVRTVRTS